MGVFRGCGLAKRFGIQVLVLVLMCSTAYAQRGADIKSTLAEIEGSDPITAAIAADKALKSKDPLLRSIALEKVLSSSDSRVRTIGLTYLVSTQKRIVVEATATESALRSVERDGDRQQLLGQLILVVEFSGFDPTTGRFKVSVDRLGQGEGAIGQDGLTIMIRQNKITLRQVLNRSLVGTVSYRLSNQLALVHTPATAALP